MRSQQIRIAAQLEVRAIVTLWRGRLLLRRVKLLAGPREPAGSDENHILRYYSTDNPPGQQRSL